MTTDEYEGSIPSLVTKQIKLIKMSKETQNIDLAESKALNIPVFMWREQNISQTGVQQTYFNLVKVANRSINQGTNAKYTRFYVAFLRLQD